MQPAIYLITCFLSLLIFTTSILASDVQPPFDIEAGGDLARSKADDAAEWGGVPALFRTPETGFGAGGVLIYVPSAIDNKVSSLLTGLVVTEKKQVIAAMYNEVFFNHNQWVSELFLSYQNYPDVYYGIGNNTLQNAAEAYTWNQRKVAFSLRRLLNTFLRIGLVGVGSYDTFSVQDPDGTLSDVQTPGHSGGHLRGLGVSARWETFDDAYSPTHGEVINVSHVRHRSFLGSRYEYESSELNIKKFWSMSSLDVFGLQIYGLFNAGDVPFYQMAQLGGKNLLRGYFQGRYRDKNFVLTQGEYRRVLAPRWGGVLFLGIGDVGKEIFSYKISESKPSAGFGLRYQLVERQRINVRLDFGFGRGEPAPGVYLYILEAF